MREEEETIEKIQKDLIRLLAFDDTKESYETDAIRGHIEGAFREGKRAELHTWLKRQDEYWETFNKYISPEEKEKMQTSHMWSWNESTDETNCLRCYAEYDDIREKPEYCDKDK